MRTIILTNGKAQTLIAFLDAFDLRVTGVWPAIEEEMQTLGIEDPEEALENAREALQQ